MRRGFCEEDVKKWYEFYKLNPSIKKTATYFGISHPTISLWFKKLGLEMIGKNRKHFFDEKFFATDTPESFYWAGFIAADGCIRDGSVFISLAIKDKEHLEKLKRTLNHDGAITIYDERPIRNSIVAKFYINSIKTVDDMKRFNIGPKKSLTYVLPEWIISHPFVNHFVRGYNDGDGCIFYSKDRAQMGVKIRGTKQCLEQIRKIFNVNCKTNDKLKIIFDSGIYQIQYSGRINLINIRDFLYKHSYSDIELGRKKDRAFSVEESYFRMPVVSTDLAGKDLKFYKSQSAAGKDGFDIGKVCCCVNGQRKTHKGRLFRRATQEEIQKFLSV